MHALVGLAVAEMNSGAVTSDERRDGVAAGMQLIARAFERSPKVSFAG